jgi:hypothetical protein
MVSLGEGKTAATSVRFHFLRLAPVGDLGDAFGREADGQPWGRGPRLTRVGVAAVADASRGP